MESPAPPPPDPVAECAHLAGDGVWSRFSAFAAQDGSWRRDFPGGHVTVGALLVDPASRSMACVLHPKFGRWMQPGGHVEPGDASLRHAAARELAEECGVGVDPDRGTVVQVAVFDEIPCPKGAVGSHFDVRVAWLHPRCELVCSEESLEVAWLPIDALPEPHDEDLAALAALAAGLL